MLRITFVVLILLCPLFAQADDHSWSLDSLRASELTVHGDLAAAAGVDGNSVVLDGASLLKVNNSERFTDGAAGFTLTAWVNPYRLGGRQQMIAAKNRYSLDDRQWGVMIDKDSRFRLYVWQDRWATAECSAPPQPGHWHLIGVVIRLNSAELWVDGKLAGHVKLTKPIPQTRAPLTFGGVDDNGRIWQNLVGALDEIRLFGKPLDAKQMAGAYKPVTATHKIPKPPPLFPLWDETAPLQTADDLPQLENVEFHVIKKWDQPRDGYTFLHGVGLAWHKGKLFASIGHNKGAENTVSEEAQYRVSDDAGKTWGPLQVIDAGAEENLAVSHGVFLSHKQALWAFHGAYYGRMQRVHTRAYRLEETTGKWQHHGVVLESGFWPMNQPVRMNDGNWIIPGFAAKRYSSDGVFPAAVAISHGDDFTKWDFVAIPAGESVKRMWGESSLFVDGKQVVNIARYGGGSSALVATSDDYGRSWSASAISNLPMATSKPAAGVLSAGQRYLVCTTAKDNGGKRTPLTIAVSRPHENMFSRVFVIRRSVNGDHPGESAASLSLSYPCAIEHEGKLYVGYSNNGGRRGNLNSAELAVIPVESLAVGDSSGTGSK